MLLLIWDNCEGMPQYYTFPDDSEMAKLAVASAGKYINGDDLPEDHAIYALNDKLVHFAGNDCFKPIIGPFTQVVVCGYIV
jgi:hypothetical protein